MKEFFKDTVSVAGVRGAMLYSTEGGLVYSEFTRPMGADPEKSVEWALFVSSLKNIQEVELLFESGRLYARQTPIGPLIVCMDAVPSAMVKLTAGVLADNLRDSRVQKLAGRMVQKKK